MKCLILRWLLKTRYHIEIEGVEVLKEPFVLGALCSSQMDPLILAAYTPSRRGVFLGAPRERVYQKWIRTLLNLIGWIPLPLFSDRAARFFGKRLLREAVPAFEKHRDKDWIILMEGESNPLFDAVSHLEKRKQVAATLQGMEGGRFETRASKKSFGLGKIIWMVFQNGIFWMPKRKIKLTFQDYNREVLRQKWQADKQVPDFFWTKKKVETFASHEEALLKEIARLSKKPIDELQKEMHLYDDLMLDSLDVTELIVFIEKEFHLHVSFEMLEKVQDVLDGAAGKSRFKTKQQIMEEKTIPSWMKPRPDILPPVGKTLGEAFLRSCDRMGKSLASTDPIETLSYIRLKTLSVGFVEVMRKFPGKEIGLLVPASGEMYAVIFSLILAGKTPVMLNWSQGPRWIDQVLEQTEIKVILTTAAFLERLPMELSEKTEEKMVLLEELRSQVSIKQREEGLALSRLSADALIHQLKLNELTGDETAVLLFTSGTEKAPKGVPLSHQNLLSNQQAILEFVQFKSDDVLLGLLPLFHVYGFSLTGIFPLLIGLKVVYHPSPLDFQGILKQIPRWKVTTVATVPTFLRGLLQLATLEVLESVRRYVIGAEKPPADLMQMIPSHTEVIEGYGLTECSPVLTLRRASRDLGVGKILAGIDCLIVDPETFEPLVQGKTGLILVKGSSIFAGYYHSNLDPFKTIQGSRYFNTQDLGFFDEQGFLHLQGRQSRTVKIGGEMISLPSIEEIVINTFVSKHPSLQVAVMGESDFKKGSHLILFTNQELSLDEVNHALNKAGMSPLLKISSIEKVDSLPLTPMGKIDYSRLNHK